MKDKSKEDIKVQSTVAKDGAGAGAGDALAASQLEGLGYKQELKRNLGMISVLGLSFAIMAVPFGTSTTLNIALTDGGPVTILYGVSRIAFTLGKKRR